MRLTLILERDEGGMVVAEFPAIPGCVSQGASEEEALANLCEAIQGCIETRRTNDMPVMVLAPEGDPS